MASFKIEFAKTAAAEFNSVPFQFRRQINQRIMRLQNEPRPTDSIPVGESTHRLRVFEWRVLYEIDEAEASVRILAVIRG